MKILTDEAILKESENDYDVYSIRRLLRNTPAYKPDNPALTLDELKRMDGEPVWFVDKRGYAYFVLIDALYEVCVDIDGKRVSFKSYNVEWRAYRYKRKGESV